MNHRIGLSWRARKAVAVLMVVLVASATSYAFSPAAAADSDGPGNGGPVNTAVVENTKDGSSVFKLAFQVRSISQATTVDPQNAAVAIASCTSCQTVAIAVQVVFVVGSPRTFSPENAAVAVNVECSFCDTLATAYQFIVQSSVPVRLTTAGKQDLHDIRKALADLDGSGLTVFEIQAKVDELMDQLATVLATEVEPIPSADRAPPNDVASAEKVSFKRDIAPVLLNNCLACHGPKKSEGGYRIDTFERLASILDEQLADELLLT